MSRLQDTEELRKRVARLIPELADSMPDMVLIQLPAGQFRRIRDLFDLVLDSRDAYWEANRRLGVMMELAIQTRIARPTIVCLCGSTRFYGAFQRAQYEETMAGRIVLSVGFYRPSPESESERVRYEHHGENIGCTPEQKIALDALHLKKIDLADEVLILNVGGYIGESTARELAYARELVKVVRFLEPETRSVA